MWRKFFTFSINCNTKIPIWFWYFKKCPYVSLMFFHFYLEHMTFLKQYFGKMLRVWGTYFFWPILNNLKSVWREGQVWTLGIGNSRIMREMQIKIRWWYHLTSIRVVVIKEKIYWNGEIGPLVHCWQECKLVQPLWKWEVVQRFSFSRCKSCGNWLYDNVNVLITLLNHKLKMGKIVNFLMCIVKYTPPLLPYTHKSSAGVWPSGRTCAYVSGPGFNLQP